MFPFKSDDEGKKYGVHMRVTLCNQSGGSPESLPLSPEETPGFTTPTLPSSPRWLSSGSGEESMGSSMNAASVPPPLTLPSPHRAALLLPEDHEGVFKTGHLGPLKPLPLDVARIQQFPVGGGGVTCSVGRRNLNQG